MSVGRSILLLFLLLCSCSCCLAATTYNWTNTSGDNSWTNANNWAVGGSSNGKYPGQSATDDIVQIAVTNAAPEVKAPVSNTIGSITFGVVSGIILTVDTTFTLNVTGNISQSPALASIISTTTTLAGKGTISCASLQVGSTSLLNISLTIFGTNLSTIVSKIRSLQISGDLDIYGTSNGITIAFVNLLGLNNAYFSLQDGTTTIGGQILTNTITGGLQILSTASPASAKFSIDLSSGSTLSPHLTLTSAIPINTASNANSVDFYNPTGTVTSTATVEYAYTGTGTQTIYTDVTTAALNTSTSVYQNITFSGSGTKSIPTGNLTIAGDWNSSGGTVDAVSNSPAVIFQGPAQNLTDGGSGTANGVVFQNVTFQGGNTKKIKSGNFFVSSSGVLNMAGSSTLNANGNLTLVSDSTGSANVAAIPLASSITGIVNVQRFIKGSSTSLTKRGYRIISSAVYTGSPGGTRVYDVSYLLNNAFVSGSGGVSNGFNTTGTNPSLYLYREDIIPVTNTFTAGNFKGIAKINNTNLYDIGTQKRLTTANIVDTTVNIPIGNGLLFFFRGNKTDNTTQTGTKTTAPFDYPEDVVFTQTGTLNTGTVNLKLWFRSDNLLSFTNTSLANSAIRGYCMVGNPYASTINWEKFNRNGANSSIYGANIPAPTTSPSTIWVYNPSNKQYESYMQKSGTIVSADTTTNINPGIAVGAASNMIATGEGFFIRASAGNQSLTFTETAKTTARPVAANLNKVLSISHAAASVPNPLLRLQLFQDTINTDEVVIALNNNAGNAFAEYEDAEDIGGNGAAVSLSAFTSDSVKVAIDQIPFPQKKPQFIGLLATAITAGTYTLKLTQQKNLPAIYQVWLKDNYLKDSIDMGKNLNYAFSINTNTGSYSSSRFQLVIRENAALALHLLSFNAQKIANANQVKATWTTENEFDYTTFYLERSIDNGKTFQSLGLLQSNGSGNYALVDQSPVAGQNLYRLKMDDINDDISYSNVITVTFSGQSNLLANSSSDINIYPNPAADVVNLKMTPANGSGSTYNILIMNTKGSIIKTVTSSQTYWQENVSTLTPGMYLMKVIDNQDKSVVGTGKFVKL